MSDQINLRIFYINFFHSFVSDGVVQCPRPPYVSVQFISISILLYTTPRSFGRSSTLYGVRNTKHKLKLFEAFYGTKTENLNLTQAMRRRYPIWRLNFVALLEMNWVLISSPTSSSSSWSCGLTTLEANASSSADLCFVWRFYSNISPSQYWPSRKRRDAERWDIRIRNLLAHTTRWMWFPKFCLFSHLSSS